MSNGINWANIAQQMVQNRMQMAQPIVPQPQLPALGVIFVDGRAGADAYPLPANCDGVPLFDRETGTLYIKSTDAYNKATITEFEPPVPKQTEADIQKAMLVKMDERMTKIESALDTILNGGVQNGGKEPNNGGSKKPKPYNSNHGGTADGSGNPSE